MGTVGGGSGRISQAVREGVTGRRGPGSVGGGRQWEEGASSGEGWPVRGWVSAWEESEAEGE